MRNGLKHKFHGFLQWSGGIYIRVIVHLHNLAMNNINPEFGELSTTIIRIPTSSAVLLVVGCTPGQLAASKTHGSSAQHVWTY